MEWVDRNDTRERFVIPLNLKVPDGWAPEKIGLVDSGAEVNLVSELLAKEAGWTPLKSRRTIVAGIDGRAVTSHNVYDICVRMSDSWGTTREATHTFYGIQSPYYPVVLGYPWLRKTNPHLRWEANTWRYPYEETDFEIVNPSQFILEADNSPHVFAICVSDILTPESVKVLRNDSAVSATGLPREFEDFHDVFDMEQAGILADHSKFEHAIETTGDPPFGPLYNLSQNELKVLKEYLEGALQRRWIQPSKSSAGAPVLFVPKKDGGLRLCVDYRGLNNLTKKNRYPLPLISETLDRLVGAKVFTKIDLKDAYYRLRIREGDEWKTAFRTRYGHFEYLVMPFGLANAPATFQAYINHALGDLLDCICVVYLDDILIYSENEDEHTLHVRMVLERLRQYKLYANPKKCFFRTKEIDFLGFIVTPDGVRMEESRVTTITEWPLPTSVRELQVFLGFANFYRRFIAGYSQMSAPLSELLKGDTQARTFEMTEDALAAFQALVTAFTTAPMLQHFNPSKPIRVEVDASGFAIGGAMSQPADDGDDPSRRQYKPVAFFSRKLTPPEMNYETHDAELLAIVVAFKHWRHYLEGSTHQVVVITDHNNLKYFMTTKELNGRQARWAEKLSRYDFVVEYRPGRRNPADGPSRRPDYNTSRGERGTYPLSGLQQKLRTAMPHIDDGVAPEVRLGGVVLSGPQSHKASGIEGEIDLMQGQTEGERGVRPQHEKLKARTLGYSENETREVRMRRVADVGLSSSQMEEPSIEWGNIDPVARVMSLFRQSIGLKAPDGSKERTHRENATDGHISAQDSASTELENNDEALGTRVKYGTGTVWPSTTSQNTLLGPSEGLGNERGSQEELWHPENELMGGRDGAQRAPGHIVAGTTVVCRLHVPRSAIVSVVRTATAYSEPSSTLYETILELQQGDAFAQNLKSDMQSGSYVNAGKEKGWRIDPGGLLRRYDRVFVPCGSAARGEILYSAHDDPHSGHFGRKRTKTLLQRHWYWDTMTRDVNEYVDSCDICQRTKVKRHRPYGLLASLPIASRPWSEISMDFITDLPPSCGRDGRAYDALLVIIDRYTKFARYFPCLKTITAEQLADLFIDEIYRQYGTPDGITSDRGSVFTSQFWSSLCWSLKVTRRLSTAFHPQTDGQTERQNQTIEHYLRCYSTWQQDDWVQMLGNAEFSYNNSAHATTGVSPFFALYGYHPNTGHFIEEEVPGGDVPTARERGEEMVEMRKTLGEQLLSAAEYQSKWYDKKHKTMSYALGDWVMLSTKNLKQLRPNTKLAHRFTGPFQITAIRGTQAYKLGLPLTMKVHPTFHVSLLEPYQCRPGEDPADRPQAVEEEIDGEEEYEVEQILQSREVRGKCQYLVRWVGWPPAYDQWLPESELENAKKLMEEFKVNEKRRQGVSTGTSRRRRK